MGACYAIYLRIKIYSGDVEAARAAMKRCFEKHINEGIGFCLDEYNFDPASELGITDYLELYFVSHQNNFDMTVKESPNVPEALKYLHIQIYSGFDARYGWHSVMYEFFKSISKYLQKGSYLKINDDDCVTYKINEKGEVI